MTADGRRQTADERQTTAFDRFFLQGMKDAVRSLPPLAEAGPDDERAAITVLESSAVVRFLDRAVVYASRALETSVALAMAQRVRNAVDAGDRTSIVAIALLVAPLVHVGLVISQERPSGWLWLILPALSVGIGVVTTVVAGAKRGETG